MNTETEVATLRARVDMLEQAVLDHHRLCAQRTWYIFCAGIAVIGFLIVKVMGW